MEIDILLNKKVVNVGYRQCCGKKDKSEANFKSFEKELIKRNILTIKKPVKVDNSYATSKGGFWNEYEYKLLNKEDITPNVNLIITEKYRLIENTIPREVRKELNDAVKKGILGHIKKDGLCRECYYFMSFENEAKNAIYNDASHSIEMISNIIVKSI